MRLRELTKISPETYQKCYERDGGRCIICGKTPIQMAHYIGRSQGGFGIEENLVCLCVECHIAADNGNSPNRTRVIRQMMKLYLESHYPGWNEDMCKWKGKVYENRNED